MPKVGDLGVTSCHILSLSCRRSTAVLPFPFWNVCVSAVKVNRIVVQLIGRVGVVA